MNQIKVLYMTFILSLAGMGTWVWKTKTELQDSNQKVEESAKVLEDAVVSKEMEMKNALSTLEDQHQKEVSGLIESHQKQLDDLRGTERQRMAAAFEQFSDIIDGNKKTLDYIDLLEKKVKSGQDISVNEAQKLATIASGLGYLQKQYQKPFQEFNELEAYLSKRAEESLDTPNMKGAFWKRIFSREFREQEREFYRTEGERRGFQDAKNKFDTAYKSAQNKMAGVNLDLENTVKSINQLIDEKKQPENLDSFFDQARKALQTHQKVLEFQPDNPPLQEPVKP